MLTFLITFAIFAAAMAALVLGRMWGGKGAQGSCGGNAVVRQCGACKEIGEGDDAHAG